MAAARQETNCSTSVREFGAGSEWAIRMNRELENKSYDKNQNAGEIIICCILFLLSSKPNKFYFITPMVSCALGNVGQVFIYPNNLLTLDLVLLFFMALLEAIRLYFGTKGNLTEEEAPLGISLGITVGSVILSVYFLVWQTYILRADVIINVVLLIAYGLEGILQIIAIAAFVS